MKKAMLFMAAAVIASALCFGAAGCAEQGIDPETFSSETVTAEQWTAAFEDDNFVSYRLHSFRYLAGDDGVNESGICTKEENRIQMEWTLGDTSAGADASTEATMRYCEKTEDGTILCYESADGSKWQETPDYGAYKTFANPANGFLEIIEQLMEVNLREYETFTYSEAQKGYVFTQETSAMKDTVTLKFQSGKIVAILWERMEGETKTGNYICAITYGKQNVVRPKVEEPSE